MSTFLNNFFPADTAAMDPIFYSPSNGIPSESKLATYMNRQNAVTPNNFLNNSGFSLLNLDSPLSIKKSSQVTPQSPEFIPTRLNSSTNYYSPYHNHSMQLTNGVVNGLTPTTTTQAAVIPGVVATAKSPNGTTTSMLGLQKATAVTVAQQKLQQQQQQQQPLVVNGNGTSVVNTPLKSRNTNMMRNDSPTAAILIGGGGNGVAVLAGGGIVTGEKTPPHGITPHGSSPIATTLPTSVHQENVGGTIYFYPTTANHSNAQSSSTVVNSVVIDANHPAAHHGVGTVTPHTSVVQQSLLYTGHVYPGPASNVISIQPKTQLESAFFMPDEMRTEVLHRNEISNALVDPTDAAHHALPLEVDNYHALYPLEPPPPALHTKMSLPASTYRATHNTTGFKYCLRRLHGFRLQSTKCLSLVEMWKKLQHTNVVQLREVFTTKAFGDNSLVLVYDYHPSSQTLLTKYFTPTPDQTNGAFTDPFQGDARPFSHKSNMQRTNNGPLLPEATIWSIIMQLTAGLRAMHQANLACKVLDPTKIILTGKRVRFSFPCISDVTQFDPNATNPLAVLNMHQQEDLTALGRLVLALACRCLQSVQRDNVQSSIEMVARHYSSDLRNFIVYLFSQNRRTVTDLMPMIGARFYTQLEALQTQIDVQEDELAKEMENGRLYRILVKFNLINERPEYASPNYNINMDNMWSETGDRYMLKLFRDYMFHSVTEDGRPWLDHAHIVQCLNKLDAGSLERVQLMSRDEQSVIIVTYAELKNCLENAFSELMAYAST